MSLDFLTGYDPTTTSLINAGIGAIGSGIASGQQQAGAQQAANIAAGQQGKNVGYQAPYTNIGAGATSLLGHFTGAGSDLGIGGYAGMLQPFDEQTFRQYSPAYQFQQQQGMQGVLNGSSHDQSSLGGNVSKELIDYNQGLANTAFNNAFGQYQTQQNNIYQRLAGLAGMGAGAANSLTSSGTNLAQYQGSALAAKGTYGAQGTQGIAGALAGGLSNAQYGNFLRSLGIGGSGAGDEGSGVDTGWLGSMNSSVADEIGNWDVAPISPDDTASSYANNDPGWDFNSAGGEAALKDVGFNPDSVNASNINFGSSGGGMDGNWLGTAGTGAGIVAGALSGNPVGQARAGLSAAQLGAKQGAFGGNSGSVGQAAGIGGNVLGIYSGLKQGGVMGDASAALNAGSLASKAGLITGAASDALGYAAPGLGLISGIKQGGVLGYGQAALSAYQLAGAIQGATAAGSAAGAGAAAGGAAASGGSAAGGAALGAGAGAAAAVALPLAIGAYALSTNPVNLKASWWNTANDTLKAGPGNTAAQTGKYWGAVSELLGMIGNDPLNASQAQQLLTQYGISFPTTSGAGAGASGAKSTQANKV